MVVPNKYGFKASETLLGIETRVVRRVPMVVFGFKASETLLGIETSLNEGVIYKTEASKPLKPF